MDGHSITIMLSHYALHVKNMKIYDMINSLFISQLPSITWESLTYKMGLLFYQEG
jgi:hypothetical protein